MAPATRSRAHRAAFWACFAVVALQATSAHPQGQRVQLTYIRDEGAESCPDEGWLKRQIAGHLGYDPFFTGHASNAPRPRQISCRLSKATNKEEFVATLQTAEPNGDTVGRRQLRSGPSCDALAASVVLSLSMAIDPIAAETARPPVPPPTAIAPPVAAVVPGAPPVDPLRLWLAAAGVVANGWQNAAASPGASLDLHMQQGRWSAFVEGRATLSESTRQPSLKTRLLLGGLGVCRAWCGFHMCAASLAGPLFAKSPASAQQNNVAALVAVGPRLVWSHAIVSRLRVQAGIEAYANVVRPRVLVDDVVIWSAAAGTAAVTLGLGWELK